MTVTTPRKRTRRETEQEDDEEEDKQIAMELDKENTLIEAIPLEQLGMIQSICQEFLEKCLFMEIDVPFVQEEMSVRVPSRTVHRFDFSVPHPLDIHELCSLKQYSSIILNQDNIKPDHFSCRGKTPRFEEIKNYTEKGQDVMLGPEDTTDLATLFIEFLHSLPRLIPKSLHAACQGIRI